MINCYRRIGDNGGVTYVHGVAIIIPTNSQDTVHPVSHLQRVVIP